MREWGGPTANGVADRECRARGVMTLGRWSSILCTAEQLLSHSFVQ
jgi:hypothetical protein